MRIYATLADQLEFRQSRNQRRAYRGALADQHQRLGVFQALGEFVFILGVVVPDGYIVMGDEFVRIELADGVLVVV